MILKRKAKFSKRKIRRERNQELFLKNKKLTLSKLITFTNLLNRGVN